MSFDPKKPVQLRDGTKARILATDLKSTFPIVAAHMVTSVSESIDRYRLDGGVRLHGHGESQYDLVNIPEEKVSYVNVYGLVQGSGYREGPAIDTSFPDDRITLKLTRTDGKITKVEVVAS